MPPMRFPLAAALLLCFALVACGPAGRPGEPPRDVVLVTVDTLRADHLSSYLYGRPTSGPLPDHPGPGGERDLSIDGLAGEGVLFSRAFAPRGQTFPSIATLMTGRTAFEHGAIDNRDLLGQEAITLAELLGEAGFATGAFTTNQLLVPGSGIEQGFQRFFSDFVSADRDLNVVQRASQWVGEQRAAGRPMFLWLHLMGPHLPYDPNPLHGIDFAALFADPDYTGEADGSRAFLDKAYAEQIALSPEDIHQVVALYDGEIARINRLLSLFFYAFADRDRVGAPDHLDRALLVFTSDHGEDLHQRHGYWAHSKSVYDSSLHVPLFFRHPPSLTGRRVLDEIVELADVAPTVLEMLGLPVPGAVSGRSLLPLTDARDRRLFDSRPAFGHWRNRIFAVRTERWRLVLNPDGVEPDDFPPGPYPIPPLALYDTLADPLERIDVSADHPEVVERLRTELELWVARQRPARGAAAPISAERWQALQALGYVGPDEQRPAGPPNGSSGTAPESPHGRGD